MPGDKANERIGAADLLAQIVGDNAAAFTAKGLAPATLVTSINTTRQVTSSAESARESLKQQVKAATAAYDASAEVLYQVLTDLTDPLAGAAGKKTAPGKTVLTVRRQLNAARGDGGVDPPASAP